MQKGLLVINEFLKSEKFEELYKWILESAKNYDVYIDIKTNKEMMIEISDTTVKYDVDFVLFWDKDVVLAKYLEKQGIRVFNSSKSIEICDDKALTHVYLSNGSIKMPKTVIFPFTFNDDIDVYDEKYSNVLDDIINKIGLPMVVKARKGSFGAQVHLVSRIDEMYQLIKKYKANNLIFQEYIESSFGRDIRLQVVGDKVVASMYRYSKDDFRTNITNGGKMKSFEPSNEAISMALKVTKELGLDFAGVDILFGKKDEPILCEVNSNAHFINIYNCTGVNVADCIFEYILKLIR